MKVQLNYDDGDDYDDDDDDDDDPTYWKTSLSSFFESEVNVF